MKYNIDSFQKGLPRWSKGVIVVGATLIIGYVAFKMVKAIGKPSGTPSGTTKDDVKEPNAAEKELNDLKNDGVIPSVSNAQLEIWSNLIVKSLEGCTEDEQTVIDIFKNMKNDADVLALISVFKVREVLPCAVSSPISWLGDFTGLKKFGGTLTEILKWGLNEGEMNEINNILKSKNIKYRF